MDRYNRLTALSPLDGRYQAQLTDLATLFSESSLIKYRLFVEIQYLLFLSRNKIIKPFSPTQTVKLKRIYQNFNQADAQRVKANETITKHDVKAVEFYLRQRFNDLRLPNIAMIHFGLTSEDINNLSYSLAITQAKTKIIVPVLKKLIAAITTISKASQADFMLARTHGQPAVPTSMGKELVLFAVRLNQQLQTMLNHPIEGKLNGAVGNFNAHQAAYPRIDWLTFSQRFIKSLGLKPTIFSTQILIPDSYIRLFQQLQLINSILVGLCQDLWRYISDDYLLQKVDPVQVGSSTMPHKINPIDFENCEGNLGVANALLRFFSEKLAISRLQRDLSDSPVKRNIGSALGYCSLGYQSCLSGLSKITVNRKLMKQQLNEHWEIISEGIQTILRTHGDEQAYEKLKQFSRGKPVTATSVRALISSLSLTESIKQQLLTLSPLAYVGLTKKITQKAINKIGKIKST